MTIIIFLCREVCRINTREQTKQKIKALWKFAIFVKSNMTKRFETVIC